VHKVNEGSDDIAPEISVVVYILPVDFVGEVNVRFSIDKGIAFKSALEDVNNRSY
jgi:hypothetical protein